MSHPSDRAAAPPGMEATGSGVTGMEATGSEATGAGVTGAGVTGAAATPGMGATGSGVTPDIEATGSGVTGAGVTGGGRGGAPLLSVRNLRSEVDTEFGTVGAVDGVSFDLYRNEVLAIVGESGCGKTMLAQSILGLLPPRTGRITAGEVLFDGEDLTRATPARLREIRGARIAMIFQDALTGLHPLHRVGNQIAEMIRAHERTSRAVARRRAVELLDLVGIPAPERRADSFPHELSGGMRQRVMIAMATALDPDVLIADEPTTALDVTVQAQVLETLAEIKQNLGGSILLITHDFGVVSSVANRVMVMYAGKLVEKGAVGGIYRHPRHPYTAGLLAAMPQLEESSERLRRIAGTPPSLIDPPPGCRFAPRCGHATAVCTTTEPDLRILPSRPGAPSAPSASPASAPPAPSDPSGPPAPSDPGGGGGESQVACHHAERIGAEP